MYNIPNIIIISLRFILETQIVELLLEGVLLAAAHARACLPLVLISSRELLRWHLVGELWEHGWEIATHVLAGMTRTMRRWVLRLRHELLLLRWRGRLAILTIWLWHVVQLLTGLLGTSKSWWSDCTSLIREEVLRWHLIASWRENRRRLAISMHFTHTVLLILMSLLPLHGGSRCLEWWTAIHILMLRHHDILMLHWHLVVLDMIIVLELLHKILFFFILLLHHLVLQFMIRRQNIRSIVVLVTIQIWLDHGTWRGFWGVPIVVVLEPKSLD